MSASQDKKADEIMHAIQEVLAQHNVKQARIQLEIDDESVSHSTAGATQEKSDAALPLSQSRSTSNTREANPSNNKYINNNNTFMVIVEDAAKDRMQPAEMCVPASPQPPVPRKNPHSERRSQTPLPSPARHVRESDRCSDSCVPDLRCTDESTTSYAAHDTRARHDDDGDEADRSISGIATTTTTAITQTKVTTTTAASAAAEPLGEHSKAGMATLTNLSATESTVTTPVVGNTTSRKVSAMRNMCQRALHTPSVPSGQTMYTEPTHMFTPPNCNAAHDISRSNNDDPNFHDRNTNHDMYNGKSTENNDTDDDAKSIVLPSEDDEGEEGAAILLESTARPDSLHSVLPPRATCSTDATHNHNFTHPDSSSVVAASEHAMMSKDLSDELRRQMLIDSGVARRNEVLRGFIGKSVLLANKAERDRARGCDRAAGGGGTGVQPCASSRSEHVATLDRNTPYAQTLHDKSHTRPELLLYATTLPNVRHTTRETLNLTTPCKGHEEASHRRSNTNTNRDDALHLSSSAIASSSVSAADGVLMNKKMFVEASQANVQQAKQLYSSLCQDGWTRANKPRSRTGSSVGAVSTPPSCSSSLKKLLNQQHELEQQNVRSRAQHAATMERALQAHHHVRATMMRMSAGDVEAERDATQDGRPTAATIAAHNINDVAPPATGTTRTNTSTAGMATATQSSLSKLPGTQITGVVADLDNAGKVPAKDACERGETVQSCGRDSHAFGTSAESLRAAKTDVRKVSECSTTSATSGTAPSPTPPMSVLSTSIARPLFSPIARLHGSQDAAGDGANDKRSSSNGAHTHAMLTPSHADRTLHITSTDTVSTAGSVDRAASVSVSASVPKTAHMPPSSPSRKIQVLNITLPKDDKARDEVIEQLSQTTAGLQQLSSKERFAAMMLMQKKEMNEQEKSKAEYKVLLQKAVEQNTFFGVK